MTGSTILKQSSNEKTPPFVSPLYGIAPDQEQIGSRCYEVSERQVVVGYGGRVEREVHIDNCNRDSVRIRRRLGGGGAVFLGEGVVLMEALIQEESRLPLSVYYDFFFQTVSGALKKIGLNSLSLRGISDFCVGNRKIAGSCIRRQKKKILFQMSFLLHSQVEWMERYLTIPPRIPDYREERRHRDFVTDLHSEGVVIKSAQIIQLFNESLKGLTEVTTGDALVRKVKSPPR